MAFNPYYGYPHYSKYVWEFIEEYPKRYLFDNNARTYNCDKKWDSV